MKITIFLLLLQLTLINSCLAGSPDFEYSVLRNGVVNDTVVDAIAPSGLVAAKNGKWIIPFVDKVDAMTGCTTYFVESSNQGKTWSKPFKTLKPEGNKQAVYFSIFSAGDGRIFGAKNVFTHQSGSLEWDKRGLRSSKITIMVSKDDGRSFSPVQELKTPERSMVSCMNSIIKLKNGDIILPAYITPSLGRLPGAVYGSGFFRSKDGGKTWGDFELAFKEIPGTRPFNFNESAFAVKDDGTVVGFARIDSRPVKNMRKIISKDNGKTWSMPEEVNIQGNFPEIKRLNNGLYVMVCGLIRKGGQRPTMVFASEDGENYEQLGSVYYSRPEFTGGRPWGSGGGGTQSILPVGKNRAYVIFYGQDMELKGKAHSYIDGCLIEVQKKKIKRSVPTEISVMLPGKLKLKMNYVAPGSFQMGGVSDPHTNSRHEPVHKVTLTNGFYLGKYEVTQVQYKAVMKNNPSSVKNDNNPVERVSWYEATAFCEKLTDMQRQKGVLSDNEVYRLPTEAEWEFAARGGNKSKNYEFSGCKRKNMNDFVWYCGNTKEVKKVGLKKDNELGFHDMSGNVWEWTDDCYSVYPAYAVTDPTELHRGQDKVIRGGSWNALSNFCYVFTRSNAGPKRKMSCLGFRVLKTIAY